MKRLIAALVAFIIPVTAFVGCSEEPETPSSNGDSQASTIVQVTNERIDVHINVVNTIVEGNSSDSSAVSEPSEGSQSAQSASGESSASDEGQSSSGEGGGVTDVTNPVAGDLKSVLKIIRKTVVEVYASSETSTSAGSGVVIAVSNDEETPKSYIVTCHHVIQSASSVSVKTIDGETYAAQFIGSDPDSDLCVMAVEAKLDAATVYSGSNEDLDVGEAVVAIGNPLGTLGGTVTSGIISATNRDIKVDGKNMSLIQTDAAINGGNSGGGLFTQTGYLIGIVNAKYASSINSSVEGLGFAIPSDTMIEISTGLMETYTGETPGYIEGKYNLGCSVKDYFVGLWTSKAYVYVVALDETGCLYKAGIKVNDRLDSFEYKGSTYTVTTANEFVEHINSITFEIGDEVTFRITRGETPYTITVTILQYIYGKS